MKKTSILFTLMLLYISATAQVDPVIHDITRFNRPTTSQRAEISQKIGLNFIKINYGRPNVKKRKIFGGLLEYGKIWRLGADYQTVIDLQNEYVINGDTIPEGKYALYAIPNQDSWTLFFNQDTEGWGQYTYKAENNVYEFSFPVEKAPEFTETFTIGFLNASLNNAEMFVQWENSRIKIPITISDKHRKEIELNYTNALGLHEQRLGYKYYLTSEYLFLEDKNYDKALTYIQKAIDSGINAFYTHYLKGEILLAMGDKKAAVASAVEAKKKLQKGFSNPEWERKIEQAILNWDK